MFKPEGFSLQIFKDRYAFTEEETWEQACKRVASFIAKAEAPDKISRYEDKFYETLVNNNFVPGGRIWSNSGRVNPQLLNCYVLMNDLDSKEGWGNITKEMIITSMLGGGVGIDFSNVRPRGAAINGTRGNAPGAVELMNLIDGCAAPIRSGGQRRVAMMFSLDLDHPDIEEFLDAKLVKGKLTNANVSVRSKRTKDFIKSVRNDGDWELNWKGKYKKIVKAKALWDKIVQNSWKSAEPGFLNWELVSSESTVYYIEDLVTTNPCQPSFAKITLANGSEITMSELKIGDVLLNCNNKETIVLNKWSTGIKPVYTYEFEGGSFVGTENHKVVIKNYDGEFKKDEIENVYKNRHVVGVETINGYKTITSKIYLGEYEVFDITVSDETHTYLTNGIYVSNCGEIAMSSHDACCLGHVVLPRMIINNEVDFALLAETVRTGVRFLDNTITMNSYPLPEMKIKGQKLRRIGLGITGLADMLAILGYKYGSTDGNKFVDKLFRFISKQAYEASVILAVEKGPFEAFNAKKHLESGYMKRMPKKIRALIEEHGLRNCALLTLAPTGTVSILSNNCSSGIEPMFSPAYERRFFKDEKRITELVFHPLLEKFLKEGKDVNHFIGANELSIREHMEVQRIVQKHIDNAVSKTINFPEFHPIEDMSEAWLEYLPDLKGTTFYRDNSRKYVDENGLEHEPPLKAISIEEAVERRKTEFVELEVAVVNDCISGLCEIK